MFAHGILQAGFIAKRGGTAEGRRDVQAVASFSMGMLESQIILMGKLELERSFG